VLSLTAIFAPLFRTQLFGIFKRADARFYFSGTAFFATALLVLGSLRVFARIYATALALEAS